MTLTQYVNDIAVRQTIMTKSDMYFSMPLPIDLSLVTTWIYIPSGTPITNTCWKMKYDSIIEIRQEGSKIVATHHAVDEYGIGDTTQDAINDLLTSFVDYYISLTKRESALGDRESKDLKQLRLLLEK